MCNDDRYSFLLAPSLALLFDGTLHLGDASGTEPVFVAGWHLNTDTNPVGTKIASVRYQHTLCEKGDDTGKTQTQGLREKRRRLSDNIQTEG